MKNRFVDEEWLRCLHVRLERSAARAILAVVVVWAVRVALGIVRMMRLSVIGESFGMVCLDLGRLGIPCRLVFGMRDCFVLVFV